MPVVPASPENIARAAAVLSSGGLVAFPTETVYGLGADAFDPVACARIFAAKRRPHFDPLIVHVLGLEAVAEVAGGIDDTVRALADAFWPGPLTLVLPKRPRVPDIVTAGLPTVAVRVPSHPVARALLEAARRPIAAPSANPFGYLSPTTAAHVDEQLGELVDLVLDGGPCEVGLESTIIELGGEVPTVLRPGAIPLGQIEEVVGDVAPARRTATPAAPGQLELHYAPHTPLVLLSATATAEPGAGRVGLLAFREPAPEVRGAYAAVEVLSAAGRVEEAAARLFACLYRLDAARLDRIVVEPVPAEGLGAAIADRLTRAAKRRPGTPP